MTGVSECSQQRGNLKDDGYKRQNFITDKPLLAKLVLDSPLIS
ncbi:hypothetical protein [Photorhabdus bodei]|nr:hypothetical protein [Photorhabdus bodei]